MAADSASRSASSSVQAFRAARDFLLAHREDYGTASRDFRWPELTEFNWALDWFDRLPADRTALWIVAEDGREGKCPCAALPRRSNQVANWLRARGVRAGDRLIL